MNLFAQLLAKYFFAHPDVVHRLADHVLHGLIEHIAPSTAVGLTGEAPASPGVGLPPSCFPFSSTPAKRGI